MISTISFTIIPSVFAVPDAITIKPIPNSGLIDVCGESFGIDCYTPNPVTIDIGIKIIFSNTDTEPHFFTSGQISDNEIGIVFDSGLLAPNEIFTWSPEIVGNFSYFCPIHPWMQGMINVEQKISAIEQEETLPPTIPDENLVNPNPIEPDIPSIPDAVEIDPEPVDEKTITEMKVCTPGTHLTWECILGFLHVEFSNFLNSVYKIFI